MNDSNGDYDETMSNNDDNSSVKDLSPGTENGNKITNSKGYAPHAIRGPYSDNCDMVGKSHYEYSNNNNNNTAIRPRNFKEMQVTAENTEGTNYLENMDRVQSEEGSHRHSKDVTGNGEVSGSLRTYPSSEDLNQTVSSEHGGEKITSGSDDEGERIRFIGFGSGEMDVDNVAEIKYGILSSR